MVRHARRRARPLDDSATAYLRDATGRQRLLECVRNAIAEHDKAMLPPALGLLWASQHLDMLWEMEAHLGRHAAASS